MTSFLGAEAYQRNDVRRGWRNGYKPRTLKTRVGELELRRSPPHGRRPIRGDPGCAGWR